MACATRPWKVFGVCRRLEVALHTLEMLEGMRRVLLCMLEAVEGEICLLEVLEAMQCVLLCMLAVPEVMRCVLLCLLEALKALEVLEMLEVPEVMRCVLLCLLQALEVLETLEVWSSGGTLQACGLYLPQEPWNSRGALPALPQKTYGDRELGRCAVGVQTWRRRGIEPWRSGDALQACRCGSVEVWRSGGVLRV